MHHGSGEQVELAAMSPRSGVDPGGHLLGRAAFLVKTGLSARALRHFERDGFVTPVEHRDGRVCYSEESAEIVRSMRSCEGRCANLSEAYGIAIEAIVARKRWGAQRSAGKFGMIDPREIELHPIFQDLLPLDDDLVTSMSVDMGLNGFYMSAPVAIANCPGLQKPGVLGDGHARRAASIKAGIAKIPFVSFEFDSVTAAAQFVMSLQTRRRTRGDDSVLRLLERFDELMPRGGDRRSTQARSKPTNVGFETRHSLSALRMAHVIGCNRGKIEKARKVLREGTPEIIDAVKNGKMSINKAYSVVTKKPPVRRRSGDFKLTPQSMVALEGMGGSVQDHVQTAVDEYIERRREKYR